MAGSLSAALLSLRDPNRGCVLAWQRSFSRGDQLQRAGVRIARLPATHEQDRFPFLKPAQRRL